MTGPQTTDLDNDRVFRTGHAIRKANGEVMFRTIWEHGPVIVRHLSALTGLSKVTVHRIVGDLLEQQLIEQVGSVKGSRGPAPSAYAVRRDAAHVVGMHVGSRTVTASRADLFGRRLITSTREHDAPQGEVPQAAIVGAADDVMAPEATRLVVGLPSGARLAGGRGTFGEARDGLTTVLEGRLGIVSEVLPNIGLAGIAESQLGAGRGVSTFLMVDVEPDLVISAVIHGEMHGGAGGTVQQVSAGDLSAALAIACLAIDPELVVLGGRLVGGASATISRVHRDLLAVMAAPPAVVSGTVGDDPIVAGAICRALDRLRRSLGTGAAADVRTAGL